MKGLAPGLGGMALLVALAGGPAMSAAANQDNAGTGAASAGSFFDRLLGRQAAGQPGALAPVPPEQAFVLTVTASAPRQLALRFDVHHCCYLYRDRLRFELRDGGGRPLAPASALTPASLPPADSVTDPYFGPSAVYRGSLELRLPLPVLPESGKFALEVSYQGCSEKGVVLCYEPLVRRVRLRLDGSRLVVDGMDAPRPAG